MVWDFGLRKGYAGVGFIEFISEGFDGSCLQVWQGWGSGWLFFPRSCCVASTVGFPVFRAIA